jgi:hypothetical protein
MNFGVFSPSLVGLIDEKLSVERMAAIDIAAALWIDAMKWLGFRMREKGTFQRAAAFDPSCFPVGCFLCSIYGNPHPR